jgi:hypothetical protein
MDQRREMRFQVEQSVQITVLGQPERHMPGRIKNVSGKGIGIEAAEPVEIGSAIKVTLEDAILLGEIIYCREDETGFYLGIEIEQALYGLAELATKLRAFHEAYSGAEQPEPAQQARKQDKQQTH